MSIVQDNLEREFEQLILDSYIENMIIALDNNEKVSRWDIYRNYHELINYTDNNSQYQHLKYEIDLQFDMAQESL